jgi:uncharacterized tellurite resistance protein B-like protein
MAGNVHPAVELPLNERIDYLTVIAALVAADDRVDDREVGPLLRLVEALGVPNAEISGVLASAETPDTQRIRSALGRLAGSPLRYTLMAELVFMAHADDELADAEERELLSVAEALGVTAHQLEVTTQYVVTVRKAQVFAAGSPSFWKQKGRKMAHKLTEAQVPTDAVAVSSILFAVEGEGPSPGLAALKVGFGAVSGDVDGALFGLAGAGGLRWFTREVIEA